MALTVAERKRACRAALEAAGGRELRNVALRPEAAEALARLRETHPTDTAAVNAALIIARRLLE